MTERRGSHRKGAVSKEWCIVALFGFVGTCMTVSLFTYHHRWGRWPAPADVFVGAALLPVALPMSLARLFEVELAPSAGPVAPWFLGFWSTVAALAWLAARRRSRWATWALAGLALASSIYWQDVAAGLIGL